MFFLKLNLQDECQLYANSTSQLVSGMQFSILAGIQD